jgi:signal transduction histidine kinase
VLPLLAGRYVAVQRKAAEQAGLRERLGIAREMHDSLGRQLSLAAVQAAALDAVTRLATAIRASATELHEILGVLRSEGPRVRGVAAANGLIEEFRAAGVVVTASSRGTPRALSPEADETAYRVIEEGLTNATRHAPGAAVSVTIGWEAAGLLLEVVNPADRRAYIPGSGLADLDRRLRSAGGSLVHEVAGNRFRLHAVLPAASARRPAADLGLAVGILLLVILPAAVLLGAH